MSPHINVHWIGIRKDSNRGSVCGWFTEVGKRPTPYMYSHPNDPTIYCHMFYGRIGKELHIVPFELTSDFISMINSKQSNYKTVDIEKITSKWGKRFDEDLSMYLTMLRLRG